MQQLVTLLNQQIDVLSQLSELLDRELQLVSGREPEALMELLDEKSQLLEQVQQIDSSVSQHYLALSEHEKQDEVLTDRIDSAKSHLEQCKYKTAVNAKAVEQGQLKLNHLRNLLVESRARESLTYDKTGKTTGGQLGKGISA